MRIFLTGFMGAGKTAVGAELASLLGYPLIDLDQEIEALAGCSVCEIFDNQGETAFRALEHRCLSDTESLPEVVVATGGGTITLRRNRQLMRRLGTSVWLRPELATIQARLAGDAGAERPLWRDPAQVRELYERRLEAYRQADLEVAISARETPGEVAARMPSLLRGTSCVT